MNNELTKYIADQRAVGVADEAIAATLRSQGWSDDVVTKALTGSQVPTPPAPSQTGVATEPIQVENVQFSVDAKKYQSKPGFIFNIANLCLAFGLFILAAVLNDITGVLLGTEDDIGSTVQGGIAILIPVSVIGYLALKRMYALFASNPLAFEDIKFKTSLRYSFRLFLILTVIMTSGFIYNVLNIFTDPGEDYVSDFFTGLYFAGGLVIMSLWLYSLQKHTQR